LVFQSSLSRALENAAPFFISTLLADGLACKHGSGLCMEIGRTTRRFRDKKWTGWLKRVSVGHSPALSFRRLDRGSMLWSQFSAIFANFLRFPPIFGEKIGVFLKNQVYDQLFA
jgi:hypothetical protein